MTNGRDLGIGIVHGCFLEGKDSILSAFSWEPSCKTTIEFLRLATCMMISQDVYVPIYTVGHVMHATTWP